MSDQNTQVKVDTTTAPTKGPTPTVEVVGNTATITGTTQAPQSQNGQALPAKFKTVEDLVKSYEELERRFSSGNQTTQQTQTQTTQTTQTTQAAQSKDSLSIEAPAEQPTQTQTQTQDQKTQTDPGQSAIPAHLQKFDAEWKTSGKLSDDSYKELAEKHGLPRQYVEAYIAGLQATQVVQTQTRAQTQNQIVEEFGGREAYNAAANWAKTNLSREDLVAYNAAVNSSDAAVAKQAVAGLFYRFQNANGNPPRTQVSGSYGQGSIQPFRDQSEVAAAMRDARYRDPNGHAYRDEVLARLAASSF